MKSFAIAAAAIAASSYVSAAPLEKKGIYTPPAGWAYGYLEDYDTYHIRYLAIDCEDKHNTQFFTDCCHPLLSTQTLAANRPAYCAPTAAEIASVTNDDSSDSTTTTAAQTGTTATATTTQATTTTTAAVANAQNDQAKAKTTTQATTTTTTTQAAATTTASSGNTPSGNVMTGGYATFFYQNGQPGACGNYHDDSYPLVAIDSAWWPDQGSTESQYCGRWVNIENTNNGKTVTAQVQDVCPTCSNGNSLDLSVGAFTAIASEGDGMVPISWSWA